jgi:bifunctional non-homologous end joining protein LigD
VSVPLEWGELKKKSLRSNSFTIRNLFARLEQVDDPWDQFWGSAVSLTKARRKLERSRRA